MAMASLPIWMEGVINRKYPKWREVEHNPDGSALYMPAGVRLVEKSLLREYRNDDVVASAVVMAIAGAPATLVRGGGHRPDTAQEPVAG